MIYVIGSGPTAVSAAYALRKRHAKVCLLDVGHRLEQHREHIRQGLAEIEPDVWKPEQIEFLKAAPGAAGGIPTKLAYGSAFPYREPESATPLVEDNVKVARSYSQGGLTNVWGACVLPYPESALDAWPEEARDLSSHYRAVCQFMPLVAGHDSLARDYPLYHDNPGVHVLSPHARMLLKDLDRNEAALARQGIRHGVARVAYENTEHNCRRCGLCLHGCPYGLIYSSSMTLALLMTQGVEYRPGIHVRSLQETGDSCRIHTTNVITGDAETLHGDRVFVAAGVWGTAELMLRSMGIHDTDISMSHSDRFMFPALRWRGITTPEADRLNTLCQLFIEMERAGDLHERVHLQVYTYNDMMRSLIENHLGRWSKVLQMPVNRLLSRLIVVYGYIDSGSSRSMTIRLTSGTREKLIVTGVEDRNSRRVASRTVGRVLRNMAAFKAIPWRPALDPPGGGNHTGGCFPMASSPTGLQTDPWGRPNGWSRTHIVDSSVFPSLPAGTIAFPAMANAHRIASESPL